MKKILTLLTLLTGTALVYGQGTVLFQNVSSAVGNYTNLTLSVWSAIPGPGASTTNGAGGGLTSTAANAYYYTLLLDASSPSSANPVTGGWLQATNQGNAQPLVVNNYVIAGAMNGPNGSGYTVVTNLGSAWSGTVNFELVGWSANLGTTWSAVASELADGWADIPGYSPTANYFFGVTEGSITLGPTTGPGASLASAIGGPMVTMDLIQVPEPSTLALAGLGGLSLLLFRRRK